MAAAIATLAGCMAPEPMMAGSVASHPPIADNSPFDHALHTGADKGFAAAMQKMGGVPQCLECHTQIDPAQGRLARPGANEHAPCDKCHRKEFFAPPGDFCKT